MPALLVSFLFVVVVLPEVRTSAVVAEVRRAVRSLAINGSLFVVFTTLALASLMALNRIFLYRLLEGSLWPRAVGRWRIDRAQRPQRDYLVADEVYGRLRAQLDEEEMQLRDLVQAQTLAGRSTVKYEQDLNDRLAALRNEVAERKSDRDQADSRRRHRGRDPVPWWARIVPRRRRPVFTPKPTRREGTVVLPPYPENPQQVMPTRVGNALRKMETYGSQFFGIDPLNLWYELYSVAPMPVRGAVEDAELECDSFVCLMYSVAALGTAAALGGLWRQLTGSPSLRLWIVAGLSVVAVWFLHRALLTAIDEWSAAIRAMVNTGRKPLREKLGLPEPKTAKEEIDLWRAYVRTVHHGDIESRKALAAFESRVDQAESRVAVRLVDPDEQASTAPVPTVDET